MSIELALSNTLLPAIDCSRGPCDDIQDDPDDEDDLWFDEWFRDQED